MQMTSKYIQGALVSKNMAKFIFERAATLRRRTPPKVHFPNLGTVHEPSLPGCKLFWVKHHADESCTLIKVRNLQAKTLIYISKEEHDIEIYLYRKMQRVELV